MAISKMPAIFAKALYERRVEFSIDRTGRITSLDITQTGKRKPQKTGQKAHNKN